MNFRFLNETIVIAFKEEKFDLLKGEMNTMMGTLKEFQRTMNNSLLYSNRALYLQLKEVSAKLLESNKTTKELLETGGLLKVPELYEANMKLLDETAFELSKPIREMLGLDAISSADFDK